jgi:hypothetical protein
LRVPGADSEQPIASGGLSLGFHFLFLLLPTLRTEEDRQLALSFQRSANRGRQPKSNKGYFDGAQDGKDDGRWGNSLLNSLLKFAISSYSSYHSAFKRFGSKTENSPLIPCSGSKIVEFGQKSQISCRNEEKSLLISLLFRQRGFATKPRGKSVLIFIKRRSIPLDPHQLLKRLPM